MELTIRIFKTFNWEQLPCIISDGRWSSLNSREKRCIMGLQNKYHHVRRFEYRCTSYFISWKLMRGSTTNASSALIFDFTLLSSDACMHALQEGLEKWNKLVYKWKRHLRTLYVKSYSTPRHSWLAHNRAWHVVLEYYGFQLTNNQLQKINYFSGQTAATLCARSLSRCLSVYLFFFVLRNSARTVLMKCYMFFPTGHIVQ